MASIISASIDLAKLNKSKIIMGKNGQKYYPLNIIINDEKNKFGQDVSISDTQTKEERTSKAKKNYLGNGKTVWSKEKTSEQVEPLNHSTNFADDLPF